MGAVRVIGLMSSYFPQDDGSTEATSGRGSDATLRRAATVASFRSQERRTKSGIEFPIVIGNFFALMNGATCNDVAVVPMGVGIV